MKRRIALYILYSVAAAVSLAAAVTLFCLDGLLYAGIVECVLVCILLSVLLAIVAQDNLNLRCGKLCEEKKYREERELIEKKMKSPFFFLVRIVALKRYIRVNMALDDLPTAKRYIDRLRAGGGKGWKYMTAFFYILIKLDEGDLHTARTEYEEFRTQCAHAQIYREEIEILTAIFHRLFGTDNAEPLPAAAVASPFPVIGRVLGRAYEKRAAMSEVQWD